jgi:hypothetical protein
MLLPKFRRKSFPTLLLNPLLLLPKLSFLSLLVLKMKHLLNLPRNLSLPFTGVKTPFLTFPWLKFTKLSLKVKILLLL